MSQHKKNPFAAKDEDEDGEKKDKKKIRRITKFRLDEISIVDDPAHAPARIAIMKRKKDTDAEDGATNETLAGSVLAPIDQPQPSASVTKASNGPTKNIMNDAEKAEFEKAAEDKLTIEKARADRAEQIVELSPDQRVHYEALPSSAQGTFLSDENKDAILKNAAALDPVVHIDYAGREIRKSAGETVINLIKSNDELRKSVAASEAVTLREAFTKRAKTELAHLSGDESAKADLLEAVQSLDLEKREAVTAILKSKDAGMAKAFEAVGTSDSGEGDGSSPAERLEKLATEVFTKSKTSGHPLTQEEAYVVALDTPEGLALHAQM